MKLSKVQTVDLIQIYKLWEDHHARSFSLPHRQNLITEAIAREDDRLIAYGQVRIVAEPILVLDLNARPREKAQALELLMNRAVEQTRLAGLDRLFSFIRDPDFADLIVKKYKFERADLGEFLIREL